MEVILGQVCVGANLPVTSDFCLFRATISNFTTPFFTRQLGEKLTADPSYSFLPRCIVCKRGLRDRNAVRPSVCPSVRHTLEL